MTCTYDPTSGRYLRDGRDCRTDDHMCERTDMPIHLCAHCVGDDPTIQPGDAAAPERAATTMRVHWDGGKQPSDTYRPRPKGDASLERANTHCRSAGANQARIIHGRHDASCARDTCTGCQPCTEPMCRVCGRVHADGTCAECLALTRQTLHEIGRLCDSLPEEVEHRGINGEAMILLGPASDPERREHVEASYMAGRLPEGWIDASHGNACPLLYNEACTGCAGGELHPYTVLAGWDMRWRAELEHDEPADTITVATAIDYLDRQLTYMAGYPHSPFEDFDAAVRACRTHLEHVLHDGVQVDTGAPCLKCGVRQERQYGKGAATDGWMCPRCKTFSTEAQYRFAVKAEHQARADWLTSNDCAALLADHPDPDVHAVTAGTIRSWATKGQVRKRRDAGRTVYLRADVLAAATVTPAVTA